MKSSETTANWPTIPSGAWNALVYGRKQWYLLPPPHAVYSIDHPLAWVKDSLPSLSAHVLECVQEQGDVIYVPELWGHGVVNLEESIGFASEFLFGAAEFSL